MNDSVLVKLDQLFDKLKTASDGDDWNTVRGLVAQVASLVKVYEKPLPEEPKERGFYVTANDGLLLHMTSMMTGRRAHGMTRLIPSGMAIDRM